MVLTNQLMMDHTNVLMANKAEFSKRCQDILEIASKEAKHYKAGDEDVNLTLAMYMLGFSSYLGFNGTN